MLDRLTGKPVHLYLHLFSCFLLAAGLPSTKIPLSVGSMLILLNVLLEADFKTYWSKLRSNRIAIGLWCYIACEWISLFWTHDSSYALHDLRVKLPLYIIVVVLIAKPLTERRHLIGLLGFFLASLLVTSLINVGTYQHWWGHKAYDDIRGLSLFGSHIRYALMIGMGIALCIAWITQRLPYRGIAVALILWWTWYTYVSQVIAGYVAIVMLLFVGTVFLIAALRSSFVRWSIAGAALAAIIASVWWTVDFFQPEQHKVSMEHLEQWTANHNWYRHDRDDVIWENGYPVVAYISDAELSKAWNSVSHIDYATGKDRKDQPLYFTLWRYMTSKGLRKDSVGFSSMTPTDRANVENGIASVELAKGGLKARLYSVKHQIEHPENPNGHSLLQRLEYWKAARTIIDKHPFFGVGAGDVQSAFKDYYAHSETRLRPELQLRSHNQYLTTWITSGIPGLAAFLLWWILLLRMAWKRRLFIVMAFAAIALSSFLMEDTLETQMGVTFVAFFYGLFVSSTSLLSANEKLKP